MTYWLVRHSDLTIERPISKDLLVKKIESGEILAQDEICEGAGYWFTIQEVEEVRKYFGEIVLRSLIPKENETTSATATTPLAKAAERVIQEVKATRAKGALQESVEREEASPHAWFWGAVMALTFFGTLVLLWRGSR